MIGVLVGGAALVAVCWLVLGDDDEGGKSKPPTRAARRGGGSSQHRERPVTGWGGSPEGGSALQGKDRPKLARLPTTHLRGAGWPPNP